MIKNELVDALLEQPNIKQGQKHKTSVASPKSLIDGVVFNELL